MLLPEPRYTVHDKNHRYTIELPGGERIGPLKSVTGVLGVINKPALVNWSAREAAKYFKAEVLRMGGRITDPAVLEQLAEDASRAHTRKAKDAADLGSACHDIFEAIIKGQEPASIPPELVEPAKDFKRWRLSTDIEIVATELAVASAEHKFGGRLDAVGFSKERGGFGIVDYKTSKSLLYGNEYSYQVGGYALAVQEQFGVEVKWAEIVRFGKVPPYDSEARPVNSLQLAISGFITALMLTRANEIRLIGEPSFATASLRAEEEAAKPRKKAGSDLGF